MFKRKKKHNSFLQLFEKVQKETEEREKEYEYENLTVKEKLNIFCKNFKFQSAEYKIVWSIRILCWFILGVLACFGAYIGIKDIFLF